MTETRNSTVCRKVSEYTLPPYSEKPKLIINCDDFGYSSPVNEAVVALLRAHRVSSATLMANCEGFHQAIEAVQLYKLNDRVGIHLNLTEGKPLVQEVLSHPCLSDGRSLRLRRDWRLAFPSAQRLIRMELSAQIEKCLTHGLHPTHFDSHHHVHTYPLLVPIVAKLAKEYRVPAIRLSRNIGVVKMRFLKVPYKLLHNQYLRLRGFVTTRWFASLQDFYRFWRSGENRWFGTIECMAHPAVPNENTLPFQRTDEELLNSGEFTEFLTGFELISYSDLTAFVLEKTCNDFPKN